MLRITFTYFVGGDCDLGDLFEAAVQFGTDPGKVSGGDVAVFIEVIRQRCVKSFGVTVSLCSRTSRIIVQSPVRSGRPRKCRRCRS